ncbi:phage tail protein [Exiguobacterium sp. MER 193]|uniref:phage tail protein n=1 Tax=Exiguobacterium sp. MER 193 TaxID=2939564 RepID=UPI002041B99A|nr:phage tail protein [Exiguobacterium sp. MER 193]MCM3281507.1 phage tail protein [Exiguobacterium sp. MER 193]
MPYSQQIPEWNAPGVNPPQSLKDSGWSINQRPPADYFNWFFYNTSKALIELQLEAINTDQKGVANGVASLGSDGKVPATQLNISAPTDASTTIKGIVMLEDSVASTSTTKAATPNSVKQANDNANGRIPTSQKGQANGVATLGADGKVLTAQLPTIATTATDITITDAGNYFTSGNVEGGIQEIGQALAGTLSLANATTQWLGGA